MDAPTLRDSTVKNSNYDNVSEDEERKGSGSSSNDDYKQPPEAQVDMAPAQAGATATRSNHLMITAFIIINSAVISFNRNSKQQSR